MGERVCYAQRRQEDGTLGRVRGGHVQTCVWEREEYLQSVLISLLGINLLVGLGAMNFRPTVHLVLQLCRVGGLPSMPPFLSTKIMWSVTILQ